MNDKTDKKCSQCNQIKPLSEFYKNKNYAKGYCARCKNCISKYNKTPRGKEVCLKSVLNYMKNHPERKKARVRANTLMRSGKIRKAHMCSLCKAINVPLHKHHSDYNRLDHIDWLCIDCHSKTHKGEHIPENKKFKYEGII